MKNVTRGHPLKFLSYETNKSVNESFESIFFESTDSLKLLTEMNHLPTHFISYWWDAIKTSQLFFTVWTMKTKENRHQVPLSILNDTNLANLTKYGDCNQLVSVHKCIRRSVTRLWPCNLRQETVTGTYVWCSSTHIYKTCHIITSDQLWSSRARGTPDTSACI